MRARAANKFCDAEDDEDDDFIAFEGPMLNLEPRRELEMGGLRLL